VLENPATSMTPGGIAGKGYTIRTPKAGLWPNGENVVFPYAQPVEFKGVPHNGTYTYPIQTGGYYNFIGNPYPSALDALKFITTNMAGPNPAIRGTIYIWTHNSPINNNVYAAGDYASYNSLGGVAAIKPGVSNTAPNGEIASGQGFYAISETGNSGSVVFNNSMRIDLPGSNGQFFRGTKSKTSDIERHRVWLSLSNATGVYKQMLVGYIAGATNGKENAFDGVSFTKNTYIDFYSLIDAKKYVIQGRALPFDKNDRVPLGYKSTLQGEFVITIDEADGVLGNQPVFLEDKLTGKIHNLKNGPYSFTTQIGSFDDRFTLVYVDKTAVVVPPVVEPPVVVNPPRTVDSPVVQPPVVVEPPVVVNPPIVLPPVSVLDPTLGNEDFDKNDKSLIVSVLNHQIKINSFDETIAKVTVYDLRGRLLYENNKVNTNEYTIEHLNVSSQFLIVVTQLINGKWVTKEIVF
jgi:hypothetical protein